MSNIEIFTRLSIIAIFMLPGIVFLSISMFGSSKIALENKFGYLLYSLLLFGISSLMCLAWLLEFILKGLN